METISLGKIRTDGGTQMRVEINTDTMLEYRDKWKAGVAFGPIDVFYDGAAYWLADGFHRFYGAREAKKKEIPAKIHNGTVRDAILFACGANLSHGLKRTNADKRQSVMVLLEDSEWASWSDRQIADKCGVSHTFVASIRDELATVASSHNGQDELPRRTKGKDGKMRPAKMPKRAAQAVAVADDDEPDSDFEDYLPPVKSSAPTNGEQTPFDHLKHWWSKANPTQKSLFRDWIDRNE